MNAASSGFVPNPSTHLLLLVQQGNEGWERMVRLVQPACERWLRGKRVPHQDVADITQDTLVKIHKSISTFEKGRKFGSWVFTILHNTWVDHLRKGRHGGGEGGSDFLEHMHQLPDPIESVAFDTMMLAEALRIVEQEVSPQRWLAFRRVKLEQAEYATVVEETGRTRPAIYADVFQVMQRLRDLLSESEP